MQKSKEPKAGKRSKRLPQFTGKNSGRGRAGLSGTRNEYTGQATSIFKQLTSDILKPVFPPVVERMHGKKEMHNQIVKAVRKYHRVLPANTVIENNELPEQVFSRLIIELQAKVQLESGELSGVNFDEDKNIIYRVDEYKDIDNSFEFVPLQYFELIKRQKKGLYNLMLDMVHLASKRVGICLPMQGGSEEDYVLEHFANNLYEENEIDNGDYDDQNTDMADLVNYYKGVESHIGRILNREVFLEDFVKRVKKYPVRDAIEKESVAWMNAGIEMIGTGRKLYDFVWSPTSIINQYDEEPVHTYVYNRFVWRVSDDVWQFMCDTMDETYNNYGAAPFYHRYAVKGNGVKMEKPQFPYLFRKFIIDGGTVAFKIFKKYGSKLDK